MPQRLARGVLHRGGMSTLAENDEIPFLLTRPVTRRPAPLRQGAADARRRPKVGRTATPLGLAMSGIVTGTAGGVLALGLALAIDPTAFGPTMRSAADAWGVPFGVSLAIAGATAACLGAVVGACFASVTRYLKRWVPLAIWSLVVFGSIAIVTLAVIGARSAAIDPRLAPAVLAASVAYALLVSLSLPLRRP